MMKSVKIYEGKYNDSHNKIQNDIEISLKDR